MYPLVVELVGPVCGFSVPRFVAMVIHKVIIWRIWLKSGKHCLCRRLKILRWTSQGVRKKKDFLLVAEFFTRR